MNPFSETISKEKTSLRLPNVFFSAFKPEREAKKFSILPKIPTIYSLLNFSSSLDVYLGICIKIIFKSNSL